MEINNRIFIEKKDRYNREYFTFDRANYANNIDIICCATLALHKAILGICELDSLEKSMSQTGFNFRQSKAIVTYYIIYHLFTCCMLMDSKYEIKFNLDYNGTLKYCVDYEELKKAPYTSQEWNDRKSLESDLATNISHSDIKRYCNWLRKRINNNLPSFLITLYDSFVKTEPTLVLYEKAAYIRDRSIYRPSHVPNIDESSTQTSLNVRSQIDSLPSAAQLFTTISKIHYEICNYYVNSKSDYYYYGLYFYGPHVECKDETAKSLGYSWDALEEMGGYKDSSVPTFLAQLMELFSCENSLEYYKKFWEPIISETQKIIQGK